MVNPKLPNPWRFYRWLFNDPNFIPEETLCTNTFWILVYRCLLPSMAAPATSLAYHAMPTQIDYNHDGVRNGDDVILEALELADYEAHPRSGPGVDGGYISYPDIIKGFRANQPSLPDVGDYYLYDESYPNQILTQDAAWAEGNISKLPNFKCLVYLDTGPVPYFPFYLTWGRIATPGNNNGKPTDGLFWSEEPPIIFEPVNPAADTFNQVRWSRGQDYMQQQALLQLSSICGAVTGFEFAGEIDWQDPSAAQELFAAAYETWKNQLS